MIVRVTSAAHSRNRQELIDSRQYYKRIQGGFLLQQYTCELQIFALFQE